MKKSNNSNKQGFLSPFCEVTFSHTYTLAASNVPQMYPILSDLSAFATPDTKEMKSRVGADNLNYDLLKVPPFHYMHLLDLNTNVIRVIEGPCRYTRLDHEKVILGPDPMYALLKP